MSVRSISLFKRIKSAVALRPWLWLLGGIAVCVFFLYLWTPLSGDDLAYKGLYSGVAPKMSYWDAPRQIVVHWLAVNGRFFDKWMALAMNLPAWLLALLCSGAYVAMYGFSVVASRAEGWLAFALIAVMSVALPEWDSAYIFAVQLNYVWSAAAVLLSWILIFRTKELPESMWKRLLFIAICFIGGMSHEGASVPLACGAGAWFFLRGVRPSRGALWLIGAFLAGLVCLLASPAFRSRVGGTVEPNDTPLWLILKSEPAAVALWIGLVFTACFRRSRSMLRILWSDPRAIFAVSTLFATPIILFSGIVGRTGWFSNVYALVFMAWAIGRTFGTRPRPWVQWLLALFVLARFAGLACIQHGLWLENKEFEARYVASRDGVVEGAFTLDSELPAWTLGRLRGVPDADDLFNLQTLSEYLRGDSVVAAVCIPNVAQWLDSLPSDARPIEQKWVRAYLVERPDDPARVLTPVGSRYLSSPLELDPGDRWYIRHH